MAESKRSTTTSSSSSSSKSRKSKNDLIRSVVGSYLKQRNYMVNERFRKSELVLTQSTEQIVMNIAIKNEISKTNSFLFSNIFCLNNNPAQVDQHFAKLCNFIKCQTDFIRVELAELIIPLLCHLYIEMLKGRDWRPAIEFLRKHAPLIGKIEPCAVPPSNSPLIMNQKINGTVEEQQASGIPAATIQNSTIVFLPVQPDITPLLTPSIISKMDMFKQLVHKLSQITRIQDLENDQLTLGFRSCQYEIHLCSASTAALRRYLAKYGHSLILQILRNWFYFETIDNKDFLNYNPGLRAANIGLKKPRLCVSSNGSELFNGIPMDVDVQQQDIPAEPDYDFSEHTEEENKRFLLRNGFTQGFLRHKIREMNGGIDPDESTDRSHQGLSTMDLDDDDDEDETGNYLPALEDIPSVATKTEMFQDGINQQLQHEQQQLQDDISGLFRRITSAERLRKLQECTERLNKFQLPLCIYQVENMDDLLTSVAIDTNSCHVASGFENSSIMLWSVNRSTQIGRKPYETLSSRRCCWNVTSCDSSFSSDEDGEEEEEEDEDDVRQSIHTNRDKNYCTAEEKERRRRERDYDDPGEGSGICNLFRIRSGAEINRLNKLLPVYSRRASKRERWKQFMERRCNENVFTETGGVVLRGHSNAITDLLFSAHDPLLISVSRDLTMRAWHASDYNCRAVYRGHNHPIWCVTESPTGLYLATGSRDTTARLWSTDREFPLQIYVGHTQDVDAVAFHPNGNYIATGSTDLTVRLWCVTSGKLFRIFTDCKLPVHRISFSPDGKYLAAAGEENRVRIFDLAAGSQLTELKDHTAAVTCLAWSANSRNFVSGSADGTVRIWDATKLASSSTSSSSKNNTTTSSSTGTTTANQQNTNSPNQIAINSNGGSSTSNQKNSSSSSSSSSNNLLFAYSTGCRRIYRLHYDQHSGSLSCVGNS